MNNNSLIEIGDLVVAISKIRNSTFKDTIFYCYAYNKFIKIEQDKPPVIKEVKSFNTLLDKQ